MRPRSKTASRNGYALLLVLATVTIASVGLVTIANRTLRDNVQSLAMQADLQSKWGRISCAAAALELAGPAFEALEENKPLNQSKLGPSAPSIPTTTQLRERLVLGNQIFDLVLGDEDAKVNLNSITALAGTNAALRAVKELSDASYGNCIRQAPASASNLRRSENWGEWFDLANLRSRAGDDRILVELTSHVTLWGQGKLNIHRASEQAIRAQCAAVVPLGLGNRIVETLRESNAGSEVAILLQRTVQNGQDRERLMQVLGDGSSSFSLWVEVTRRTDTRRPNDSALTLGSQTSASVQRTQHCYIRTQNSAGEPETLQFSLD